jgi:hypothetical protein
MVVPCFGLLVRLAPFRRVLKPFITGRRFQNLCVAGAKWFHGGKEMFRTCVVATKKIEMGAKTGSPAPMTSHA